MTFDYSDYAKAAKDKAKKRVAPEVASFMSMLEQAEVRFELLTNHPSWDTFLQIIQSNIDSTQSQRRQFNEQLCDPDLVDIAQIQYLKAQIIRCDERVAAWEAVIALPKQIMSESIKIKELLPGLGKKTT